MRHSSFNFHEYQASRAGIGKVRVFGDGLFSKPGCGYTMDRHHNLIIWAFVLQGKLTHENTIGKVDELRAGNYYCLLRGGRRQACRVEYRQRKHACILPVGTA
jgi:quercetin dioxygenase-like cupin family protein